MSQPPHLTIVGQTKPSIIRNTLLRALSADDLALLQPHLEVVELKRGDVVAEPNKPIQHVVFPEDAIISAVASTPDGRRIEVGIIGRNGGAHSSKPPALGAICPLLEYNEQRPRSPVRHGLAQTECQPGHRCGSHTLR